MNEEIKEILDRLEYYKQHDEENNYYPEDIFLKDEVWILYDYITNIQQENERLNNIINELEAWIKSADEHYPEAIPFRETLIKLKELKESDNK